MPLNSKIAMHGSIINSLDANKLSLLGTCSFYCFYLLFHLVMNSTVNLQSNEQFYNANEKNTGTVVVVFFCVFFLMYFFMVSFII